VELFPVAIAPALARPPPAAAVESSPQMAPQVFLEAASESFPALVFLFLCWLLSLSQSFCLLRRPFSFAIFSSHLLVLALEWEIFSISLEQQLIQASPLALASPPLARQILSPVSFCYDVAILLTLAMLPSQSLLALPTYRFCCPTLRLPASLSESDSVISWVSRLERRASRVGFFRIRRPIFPPRR
jgi:hypothetical protein